MESDEKKTATLGVAELPRTNSTPNATRRKSTPKTHRMKVTRSRYNLSLPDEMMGHVKQVASANSTTTQEVMRRMIQLGLLAVENQQHPDASIILRNRDGEREIIHII